MAESKIVEAVVSAVATGALGSRPPKFSQRIQEAMAAAVRDCLAEGVPMSDVDTYRNRQLAAAAYVREQMEKLL